jgi:electron transfer flavoprotein beta subunit
MSLRIVVCIKQVPDPEAHSSGFIINEDALCVEANDIASILNPFDENALDIALKVKDQYQEEVTITVLTLGHNISISLMQKALAPGADELIIIDDELFAFGRADSYVTAYSLAAAMRKIENYDLIVLGRQSADLNAGQTAVGLAHALNLPAITMVSSIEVKKESIIAERSLLSRRVKIECPMPVVVMADSNIGMVRYPTLSQILASKKKPVTIWRANDLEIDIHYTQRRLVLRKLYKPEQLNRDCIFIGGATVEEAAGSLVERLRNDHIL